MKDGIINVYKEAGWTSSDVVVKLRHILKNKKVGHTGTLDPAAEGVLPICVGKATQLSDYIMDKTKTYEAELILGVVTDTQDNTGAILSKSEVNTSCDELKRVVAEFLGNIKQTPPMYSAVRHNGKKLYQLAREGKIVDRKERAVYIYGIEILNELSDNKYLIRVVCSKGTYIRTLCADIGEKLGCGGCMGKLIRIACDNYKSSDAYRISAIEEMINNDDYSFLLSMEGALYKYPRVTLKNEFAFHFLNGLDANNSRFNADSEIKIGDIVRVYVDDMLCAVAIITQGGLHIKNILVDVDEFLGGIGCGKRSNTGDV